MKIQVTKECIEKGQRKSKSCCPIALALKEAGYRLPLVGSRVATFRIAGTELRQRVFLPAGARDFVEAFDSGLDVEPTVFELMEV